MINTPSVWRVAAVQLKAIQTLVDLASETATTRFLRRKILTSTTWVMNLIERWKCACRRRETWRSHDGTRNWSRCIISWVRSCSKLARVRNAVRRHVIRVGIGRCLIACVARVCR